jgi:hypothetical protein
MSNPSDMSSFSEKKNHSQASIDLSYCRFKESKNAIREKIAMSFPNLESVDCEIQVAEFCNQSLL